jgi:hypothetical protein
MSSHDMQLSSCPAGPQGTARHSMPENMNDGIQPWSRHAFVSVRSHLHKSLTTATKRFGLFGQMARNCTWETVPLRDGQGAVVPFWNTARRDSEVTVFPQRFLSWLHVHARLEQGQ